MNEPENPYAVSPTGLGQEPDAKEKPPNRIWALFGMAAGTSLGLVPPILPAPVGPILTWTLVGAVVGFVFPATILLSLLASWRPHDNRLWWGICVVGAEIGTAVGLTMGALGKPLPEAPAVWTGTGGFFVGYGIAEFFLRRAEAAYRERRDRTVETSA